MMEFALVDELCLELVDVSVRLGSGKLLFVHIRDNVGLRQRLNKRKSQPISNFDSHGVSLADSFAQQDSGM